GAPDSDVGSGSTKGRSSSPGLAMTGPPYDRAPVPTGHRRRADGRIGLEFANHATTAPGRGGDVRRRERGRRTHMPMHWSRRWWLMASAIVVATMAITAWATEGIHVERGISPLWPPAGVAFAWLV